MPRVLSYTPDWLQRPGPGWDMFAPKSSKTPVTHSEDSGRRKTIATRDTEIFVAVGSEIRWSDLLALKEEGPAARYRTLKASVPLPITQLVISPNGQYMAVSTSHTVHVVLLPESSLLEVNDAAPIKLKTFQVGPTAHVREESPVVSLIWHPLGYQGRCLITITREGVVRLWEVNRSDRSTFSEPTLSIDLQKLSHATSTDDNVGASGYGASKGFSPDSFELEVASACFGDYPEQEGVHGWAPMTLWIAMAEGGVYALCPLLPSKWQLPDSLGETTVLQTLATSIHTDLAELQDDVAAPPEHLTTAETQLSWISDILYAEPLLEDLPSGDSVAVFTRPQSVPACPLLQGPFTVSAESVEDFEISDIIVYSLKTFSEASDEAPAEGLPAAVICLLTDTSKVHICLDLQGVVGEWLPAPSETYAPLPETEHALTVVETIALTKDDTSTYNQSITPDVQSDFSFFVSHAKGVFYVSIESWIQKLENELAEPSSDGIDFRLQRLLASATTQAELCMPRQNKASIPEDAPVEEVNSCVVVADGNLGYFVLTTVSNEPQAVFLDAPEHELPTSDDLAENMQVALPIRELRPTYQPPREFFEPLQFPTILDQLVPARNRAATKEEIKLSPANLDILMNAHKSLSHDTNKLQVAVSNLFVQCQRLRDEFRDQITRVAKQMVPSIDAVTGNDEALSGSDIDAYGNAKIEDRLDKVKTKQEALNARYESIRRKMASIGGTDLSEKESAFIEELQTMDRSVDQTAQTLTDDLDGSDVPAWMRLQNVKVLKKDLAKEAERAAKDGKEVQAADSVRVSMQNRKMENEHIEALLQRETALVEAATTRLRSNGIQIAVPLEQ